MEHTTALFEVPELEKILAKKKKRYVGYEEGMALYRLYRARRSPDRQRICGHL